MRQHVPKGGRYIPGPPQVCYDRGLEIAGRLVEAGEDTARTEADTVEVDTAVAVNTVAVDTVEAETAAAVNTVAVARWWRLRWRWGIRRWWWRASKVRRLQSVRELATRVYPPLWGPDASLAGVHATTRGHSGLRAALNLGRRTRCRLGREPLTR